jgi:hypothetical protein
MADTGQEDLRDRLNGARNKADPKPGTSGTQKQLAPKKKRDSSSSSSSSSSTSSSDSDTRRRRRKKFRRSRSRSRTRLRRRQSRSRSRSFRLVRSPSRALYREDENVGKIANLVHSQQDFILDLISEHKAEVESKLQTKTRKFQSRQIEKQFEINNNYKDLVEKAVGKLRQREYKVVEKLLEQLTKDLEKHAEDLIIADTSQFGWLAVSKIRGTEELPKNIRRRLEQVEKDLAAQKSRQNGPARKKFQGVQGNGAEPLTKRQDKRTTPEDALFFASKQLRTGTCSHCKKELHYYRECPVFWQKVHESRVAKAKEEAGTN